MDEGRPVHRLGDNFPDLTHGKLVVLFIQSSWQLQMFLAIVKCPRWGKISPQLRTIDLYVIIAWPMGRF
jgi:hypothetical protein